jgi:hypothetical protein
MHDETVQLPDKTHLGCWEVTITISAAPMLLLLLLHRILYVISVMQR